MDEQDPRRANSIPPHWVLAALTVFLTVIGLSFCFGPAQPPSACKDGEAVMTAGSSPNSVGVCPP